MKNTGQTNKDQVSIVKGKRNTGEYNSPPFIIPADFDPTEFMNQLSKTNPSFAKPSVIPIPLLFLAMVKIITDYKNSSHRSLDDSEFAEISNKTIKGKISNLTKELKSIMEAMKAIGWIECDGFHKVGEKSLGYRIGERFRDSEWIEMPWEEVLKIYFPELFELDSRGKVTALGKKEKQYLARWNRACAILNPWEHMEDCRLKEVCRHTERILHALSIPKYDQLTKLIESGVFCDSEEERELKKKRRARANKRKKRRGFFYQNEEDSIPSLLRMVKAIKEQRFFISCHDSRHLNHTNRLTTNWSNMKREFRPYFRLNGRPLVGVDIKSCQAALLATFYSDSPEDLAEKISFVAMVTKQDIYRVLADRIAAKTGKQIDRDKAKGKCFTLMFAKINEEDRDIRKAFQEMFPVLYKRMADLKRSKGPRREGYKRVSQALQSTESKIMIEGVLYELQVEKGIDCLSVHDSIYCTKEHVETVKSSITKWFLSIMGFEPQLKLERPEELDLSNPFLWIETDAWWSNLKRSMVG
jgi:hypothetical protein